MSDKNQLVLCLSGLDPTSGAGISADIESLKITGCSCLPLISSITAQNGKGFQLLNQSPIEWLIKQTDCLFDEFKNHPIKVCKIGLMPHTDKTLSQFIRHLRKKNNAIQIIFDPIISPSSPNQLNQSLVFNQQISEKVFSTQDFLTPNRKEFFTISQINDKNNLLTEHSQEVKKALLFYQKSNIYNLAISSINSNKKIREGWLCQFDELKNKWQIKKVFNKNLKAEFHGSGCTFSSSLAGFIACGLNHKKAFSKAIKLTHKTLKKSKISGINQKYPNRNI